MEVITPDGISYIEYPLLDNRVNTIQTVHKIEHINDDNIIRIDHGDDGDNTHVFLQGNLSEDDYFIRCTNPLISATDVFFVDGEGSIKCSHIYAPEILELQLQMEDRPTTTQMVEEIVDNFAPIYDILYTKTPESTPFSLVERDANGGANFVTCEISKGSGNLATHLDLRGECQLYYIPLDQNGNQRPNAIYRFGCNHEEFDFSGTGDGLEFIENGNEIKIEVQQNAPTIEIKGQKIGTAPYLLIKNAADDELFSVNHLGPFAEQLNCDDLVATGTVRADRAYFDYLEPNTGSHFPEIAVRSILTDTNSVWLGNRLHISDSNGARLQQRKAVVPQYLLNLGASTGSFSTTLDLVPLSEFKTVSVGLGGSDDLSTIFPKTFEAHDFQIESVFNEIIIEPINSSEDSGLTISHDTYHPLLELKGNANGRGIIQFSDNSNAGGLIYHSTADDAFHIDSLLGDLRLRADKILLEDNTAGIQRGSVEVFSAISTLQTDVTALQSAGSSGPSLELLSTDTAAPAKMSIKSTDPDDQSHQVELTFEMDRTTASSDMKYSWTNHEHDLVLNKTQNTTTVEMLRYCRTNTIVLNGGRYPNVNGAGGWNGANNDHIRLLGQTFIHENLVFGNSTAWYTPTSTTDNTYDKGSLKPSTDDKLYIRNPSGNWQFAQLHNWGNAAPKHYHKYFDPDESAHQTYNNALVLPDGYTTYFIQKGDGSDWTIAGNETGTFVGKSVRVALPWNPADGTTVTLYSGIHQTLYSGNNLIAAVFPGYNYTGPSGRYVMVNGGSIGPSQTITYSTINCASSTGHSSRDIYRFSDTAGGGFWTRTRDQA